ncbi:MAG TPA: alkaline phosphatase family protein, partial [Streptosporangiaceae bacterium]|nr:alkaline phosphatase family protein [Streptosporangiaceae bacterium]
AQFFEDCAAGTLPTYSFIEPQIIGWAHNDMHPPFTYLFEAVAKSKGADPGAISFDPPSSLLGGEDLLARIYHAIRSSTANGSNHLNTTLLVTFDEHGGTYDHVPPPTAVPPGKNGSPGEMGFRFDRSGVRIPTLAISAWIPERTVVTGEYRATSLLATMRKRWNLGAPLTARDASAPAFDGVFTLSSPRSQEQWPEVVARPVPPMPETVVPFDAPLGLLGKAVIGGVFSLAHEFGIEVPQITMQTPVNGAEAIAALTEVLGKMFPQLRDHAAEA